MFYSHDLIGRKTALGAIWTTAHGKKLSKIKIMGINLTDICKEILQPDVPHSLRLQGILIGGVVIVFNKQQIYLLEDLQEMMRKVKAASVPEAAIAAVNTMLQKGRDKARIESITMMDMDDDMLVTGLDLPPPLHTLGGNAAGAGGDDDDEADELFVVPTLIPTQTQRQATNSASLGRGRSGAATAEALNNMSHTAEDELFDAPDIDQLLMDGMGDMDEALVRALGAAPRPKRAAAAKRAVGAGAAGELDAQMDADEMMEVPQDVIDPLADEPPPPSPMLALNNDFDELMPPMMMMDEDEEALLLGVGAAGGAGAAGDKQPAADAKKRARPGKEPGSDGEESEDADAHLASAEGAAPAGGKEARGRKATAKAAADGHKRRRGPQVTLDEADSIQISTRVYREWTLDASSLQADRYKGLMGDAGTGFAAAARRQAKLQAAPAAAALGSSQIEAALTAGDPERAVAVALSGPASVVGGMRLCAALLGLVNAAGQGAHQDGKDVAGARAKRQRTGKAGAGAEAADEPAAWGDLGLVQAAAAGGFGAGGGAHDDADMQLMDEMEHMEDEQQQQLGEEVDVEVERLRKANNTPGQDGGQRAALGLTPSASDDASGNPLLLQGGLATGGGRSRATTASGSSLGRESEQGVAVRPGGRSRQAAAGPDSVGNSPQLRFGNGALEDLLPAIEEADAGHDLMFENLGEDMLMPGGAADSAGGSGPRRSSRNAKSGSAGSGTATGSGSGEGDASAPLSQFALMETDGFGGTQMPTACIGKGTLTVVAIFRQRLGGLMSQAERDPSVSIFELAGQLQRKEAVRLFYQTLVTQTTGFIKASQEKPYGDILVRPGRFL